MLFLGWSDQVSHRARSLDYSDGDLRVAFEHSVRVVFVVDVARGGGSLRSLWTPIYLSLIIIHFVRVEVHFHDFNRGNVDFV